jgi:hypothetical protein
MVPRHAQRPVRSPNKGGNLCVASGPSPLSCPFTVLLIGLPAVAPAGVPAIFTVIADPTMTPPNSEPVGTFHNFRYAKFDSDAVDFNAEYAFPTGSGIYRHTRATGITRVAARGDRIPFLDSTGTSLVGGYDRFVTENGRYYKTGTRFGSPGIGIESWLPTFPVAGARKFFHTDKFTGHVLLSLGDLDNNGTVELGVAATRNADGRWRMEIKNARGANNTRAYWIEP